MKTTYNTENVCTKKIDIEIEENIIKNVVFHGGCPGNLLGISKIVVGMNKDDVIKAFADTKCGFKDTSCPDQLAKALKQL